MRANLVVVLGLVLVGSMICGPLVPVPAAAAADQQVQVTATRLNVREEPSTEARVLASVVRGDILVRLDEQEGWIKVRTTDGTVGWVSADYVEAVAPAEKKAPPPKDTAEPVRQKAAGPRVESSGGGSFTRKLLKWGCLAGAGVAGYLGYDEHSAANDTYDEYKELFNAGDFDAADEKFAETEDHDGKANTYFIVAGVLAGAYLLQEFVFDGGSEPRAAAEQESPVLLGWDSGRHEVRAGIRLLSF